LELNKGITGVARRPFADTDTRPPTDILVDVGPVRVGVDLM
jgi:hypothetical protein